jgi:thioredoxin
MITIVTNENYEREVKNHPGSVLIDFHTPGCSPCQMMMPVLTELATEQGTKLKIVKIDASEESDLALEFGVSAVPTFVLVDRGEKKAQITGFRTKKALQKWLDEG